MQRGESGSSSVLLKNSDSLTPTARFSGGDKTYMWSLNDRCINHTVRDLSPEQALLSDYRHRQLGQASFIGGKEHYRFDGPYGVMGKIPSLMDLTRVYVLCNPKDTAVDVIGWY